MCCSESYDQIQSKVESISFHHKQGIKAIHKKGKKKKNKSKRRKKEEEEEEEGHYRKGENTEELIKDILTYLRVI